MLALLLRSLRLGGDQSFRANGDMLKLQPHLFVSPVKIQINMGAKLCRTVERASKSREAASTTCSQAHSSMTLENHPVQSVQWLVH
eukprot:3694728-Amphidinium_carterae.1